MVYFNPYGDGQGNGTGNGQGQHGQQGQQGQGWNQGHTPPHYGQYGGWPVVPSQQQDQQEQGKSPYGEIFSSVAGKMIAVILLLIAVFLALHLATAILSMVGIQVEGFGRYVGNLHRTLSHRPGSPDWFGGMVQIGILLGIVWMVIGYIKRKKRGGW